MQRETHEDEDPIAPAPDEMAADGRLGRTPVAEIAEASGLTAYQVARGMKELRDKEVDDRVDPAREGAALRAEPEAR